MIRVGILTISDRAYTQVYEDKSGSLILSRVEAYPGWEVTASDIVPDEQGVIAGRLIQWCDDLKLSLILTTGGTGFAPRDVTPEATREVIDREAPGMAEAMRAASLRITPHAMLSRAVCGIRGRTLIINLPGSPKAVKENLDVVFPVLPHALELLGESPSSGAGHNYQRA